MVSVVMPLYNKAPYVERAIRSVLNQTLSDFELVVVDDGSTDGGDKLVEALSDPRIRLIRQANAGAGAARNRGISEAKYELVAFLDADDWWEPEFLAEMSAAMNQNPECSMGFSNIAIGDNRVRIPSSVPGGVIDDYFAACSNAQLLLAVTSDVVVKRSAIIQVGMFSGDRNGQDNVAWAKLALLSPIMYVNRILAHYEEYAPNSLTVTAKSRKSFQTASAVYIQEVLNSGTPQRVPDKSLRTYVDLLNIHYMYTLLITGQHGNARKVALKDIHHWNVQNWRTLKLYALSLLPRFAVTWGLRLRTTQTQ